MTKAPRPPAAMMSRILAVFKYIEGWYHPHRRHSALDYQSPVNYERKHTVAAA